MIANYMNIRIYLIIALGALTALLWQSLGPTSPVHNTAPLPTEEPVVVAEEAEEEPGLPSYVNLEVPYISEAPENTWTGSWKNGCEEAIVAMAEKYYQGITSVTIPEAKAYMQELFDFQQRVYGSDANSDATRTLAIVENNASFGATLVENPTLEQIKQELARGRPVLGFHYGFALQNENIPFLPTGSSYHTTVIKGYNDAMGQFITNDPGDTVAGADRLYDYDIYLDSLHDYNYSVSQANGPARVLFTSPGPAL